MWKDVMKDMGIIGFVAYILVLIGSINVGFFGLFKTDILGMIFGGLSRLIFILIGVSAGYLIYSMFFKKKEGV